MDAKVQQLFDEQGFVEISDEGGGKSPDAYSAGCSGGRSACCTRTCSADGNYVSSADAWERFLNIDGGEIQY